MTSEPVSVTEDRSGHTADGQGTSPTSCSCPPDTVADLLIVDSDEDVAECRASWRESSSSIEDVLATHSDTHLSLSDCDDYEHTAHTLTDIRPSLPPKTSRLKSANNVPALPDYSVCGKQPLHYTNLSLYDHEIATLLPAKTSISVSHGKAASVNNRHPVNWPLANGAQRGPTGGLTDDDSHMTFPPLPLPPLTARQHEKTERQRRGKSKHSKTVVCHYDYYMEPALCSCDSDGPLSTCCYHGTGPTAHSQLADDDLGLPHYPALPQRSRGSLALTSMQLPALHSTGQPYMAMKFAGGLPASKLRAPDPKAGYMSMDAFKTESGETSPTRSIHRDLSLPLSAKHKERRSKTENKSHYLDMGKSADDSNIAKVKASDADHLCLVVYRNTSDNDDNSGDSKYGSTGDNSNRSRSNSSGAPSQLSHTDEHSLHRPFDDLIEHQSLACRPDYTLHSPTRTPTNSSRRYTYCVTSPASLSSQQLTVTANSPSPGRKSTGEGFFTRLWRRASGSKAKFPSSPEDVRKPKTKHTSFINRKSKSKSITNLIGRLSTNDLTRDEDRRMLPSAHSEAHLYTTPFDTRVAPSHFSSSCAELQTASQPCQPYTVISGTADVGLAHQFPALSMRRIHSAPGSGYMHSAPSLSASTHSLPSPTPTMPALPPKTRRQQTLSCLPEVDTTDSVHDDTNMPCDVITQGEQEKDVCVAEERQDSTSVSAVRESARDVTSRHDDEPAALINKLRPRSRGEYDVIDRRLLVDKLQLLTEELHGESARMKVELLQLPGNTTLLRSSSLSSCMDPNQAHHTTAHLSASVIDVHCSMRRVNDPDYVNVTLPLRVSPSPSGGDCCSRPEDFTLVDSQVADLATLNYPEMDLTPGTCAGLTAGLPAHINYTQIDLIATAAAHKASEEHAQARHNGGLLNSLVESHTRPSADKKLRFTRKNRLSD